MTRELALELVQRLAGWRSRPRFDLRHLLQGCESRQITGNFGSTAISCFADQPARLPSFELDRHTADTWENPESATSKRSRTAALRHFGLGGQRQHPPSTASP